MRKDETKSNLLYRKVILNAEPKFSFNASFLRLIVKPTGARLQQSEEKYRTIMERVSDAFVALDKNWCYTFANKKAAEIMGSTKDELIGKHIWTAFPENVGQPFYEVYHKAMKEQQYIHLEEYYPPYDRWLENHVYPSPEGLSIFFRDITERKRAERKIIQSEENLKAIFENTSEGFILTDVGGFVKTFNDLAKKISSQLKMKK